MAEALSVVLAHLLLFGTRLVGKSRSVNAVIMRKPGRICRALAYALTLLAALEVSVRILFGLGDPLLPDADTDLGSQKAAARQANTQPVRLAHPSSTQILVLSSRSSGSDGEGFAPELERLIKAGGDTTAVVNASAPLDTASQLAYLRKCGTFGSRWVVLEIGSHDLEHRKGRADSSIPDGASALALTEMWTRYIKPRFFRSASTQPAYAQLQFFENMDDFLEAVGLVRRAGAFPVVIHIPARAEVTVGAADDQHTSWRDCFLEIVSAEQVPAISLAQSWRSDPEAARYFADETHLTAAGTRAAARRLALFLLSAEHRHTTERPNDTIVLTDPTQSRELAASGLR